MQNIEFYVTPHGEIEIKSEDGVRTYTRECKDVTAFMFLRIEEDYPEAHKALSTEYRRSVDNPPFFKYLCVHRFMRCNFARYDHVDDIDANGTFHFERPECPLRGHECKYYGIICNPKFNTKMSEMQMDIMERYIDNMDPHTIAEELNTSFDNVKKHISKCFKKAGVRSREGFTQWAKQGNIFQNKNL